MASIKIQGVDSINDFWCYVNDDKGTHYIASGDGVNVPEIPINTGDFVAVYVRYFLQDYFLSRILDPLSVPGHKYYIVRDHRVANGKYTYYCWGAPIYTGLA